MHEVYIRMEECVCSTVDIICLEGGCCWYPWVGVFADGGFEEGSPLGSAVGESVGSWVWFVWVDVVELCDACGDGSDC